MPASRGSIDPLDGHARGAPITMPATAKVFLPWASPPPQLRINGSRSLLLEVRGKTEDNLELAWILVRISTETEIVRPTGPDLTTIPSLSRDVMEARR